MTRTEPPQREPHPVLRTIAREGFVPLGWFRPRPEDGMASSAQWVLLLGNAGPAMFSRFQRERRGNETLDAWTRQVIGGLAGELGALALFPSDRPHAPFISWAIRTGEMHASPLGLAIHPGYGLWHALRAALLFATPPALPPPEPSPHPCERCAAKPCLHACPVAAIGPGRYDAQACAAHLESTAGRDCLERACRARRACPIGREYAHGPEQAAFHMQAFLAALRSPEIP